HRAAREAARARAGEPPRPALPPLIVPDMRPLGIGPGRLRARHVDLLLPMLRDAGRDPKHFVPKIVGLHLGLTEGRWRLSADGAERLGQAFGVRFAEPRSAEAFFRDKLEARYLELEPKLS
ncbi:MAG TPA: hypothetical protein VNI01_04485, partial [Elusimicrobiota bacterium]|nr:hypothetical protein [Elusimicrobiota bacterium]